MVENYRKDLKGGALAPLAPSPGSAPDDITTKTFFWCCPIYLYNKNFELA